jgi:hypothetical protein
MLSQHAVKADQPSRPTPPTLTRFHINIHQRTQQHSQLFRKLEDRDMDSKDADSASNGASSLPTSDIISQLDKAQKAISYAETQLRAKDQEVNAKDEEIEQLKDENKAREVESNYLRLELSNVRRTSNRNAIKSPRNKELMQLEFENKAQSVELQYLRLELAKARQEKSGNATKAHPDKIIQSQGTRTRKRGLEPLLVFNSSPGKTVVSFTNEIISRSNDLPAPKMPKLADRTKVVQCVKCYVHGWKCDKDQPCFNCFLRGKQTSCKRMMCQNYASGTCQDVTCPHAHEGDGYMFLNKYRTLHQEHLGKKEPGAGSEGSGDDSGDDDKSLG